MGNTYEFEVRQETNEWKIFKNKIPMENVKSVTIEGRAGEIMTVSMLIINTDNGDFSESKIEFPVLNTEYYKRMTTLRDLVG
jgi:hypothetical protein